MYQRTFSIIKPDAVRKGYTGAILAEIEKAGNWTRLKSGTQPSVQEANQVVIIALRCDG